MKILDNNSLIFYLELKRNEKHLASFPLCVDVMPISLCRRTENFKDIQLSEAAIGEENDMMQLQVFQTHGSTTTSVQSLPTIEDLAVDVSSCIPEVEEMSNETGSEIISFVSMNKIAEKKVFRNKILVKKSISLYAIHNNFQFKVSKSDKKKYVLKCIDDSCKWSFRASRLGGMEMFKIRYMRNDHTCSNNIILADHRQATNSIVGECIKYKYVSTKITYTPADIISDMMNTYGVSMSYEKAWRSKEKALELVRGDPTESYENVPKYLYVIEKTNPESITRIETYDNNKFKYLFMALGTSIQGWEYCRPIIVIDGTFLKGHYGGTLFTACTQDVKNNIFILTFGVGDLETNDSWE
ncbi:MuDR family transposase [Abeliophyllum distichum]|uniref:MuDR family transposase n=1 Tax=Abeliophyllum distichum TaxID=126358 RepID=A0ABD1QVV8_9LAMI